MMKKKNPKQKVCVHCGYPKNDHKWFDLSLVCPVFTEWKEKTK